MNERIHRFSSDYTFCGQVGRWKPDFASEDHEWVHDCDSSAPYSLIARTWLAHKSGTGEIVLHLCECGSRMILFVNCEIDETLTFQSLFEDLWSVIH
jgi:hypothetical protein